MKSHYETIIIGGGISGLSCARKLYDAHRDFLLIAEELGGRMKYDEETGIDLGAGFVLSDYKNVLQYVGKKKHHDYKKEFLCDEECMSLSDIVFKNLKNLPKVLKVLFFVWKLNRHLEAMRNKLPFESVKEAIEKDKFLLKTFTTPAKEFVRKHHLEKINEDYINPIISCTFYNDFDKVNTYYYLGTLTPLLSKIYIPDFKETVELLANGFKEKIYSTKVLKVTRKKDIFVVKTSKKTFTSENIVFAAPEKSLRKIYSLPRPHIQQPVHRFIIQGKRRKKYQDKQLIFNPKRHDIFKMSGNERGYDLVTSKKSKPNFIKYYEFYKIVKHIHWKPATIIPNKLIDQNLEKNAYIASDYNLCCLEDSFLTGLYAANSIIQNITQ